MSKTILITGSSSGIGKATAKYFQSKGWNVIATMRTPEKEKELKELKNVLVTKLDVLDSSTIQSAIANGISQFGQIDVFVNNAGFGVYGILEAIPSEQIVRQFNTNVIGLLECSKAIIPHFRKNKSGILINVSSIGGKITMPFGSLYHGTKFAVEGVTETLSYEMSAIGAKVKIVEPGGIDTNFEKALELVFDESLVEYQSLYQKFLSGVEKLMGNSSKPSVVAEVIYEAATDGTDRLRYIAGNDGKEFLAKRKELNDEEFMNLMKDIFGI